VLVELIGGAAFEAILPWTVT